MIYILIFLYNLNISYASNITKYYTTNTTEIKYRRENLMILYILLVNLIMLLIIFLGFYFKIIYKKYIDNKIVL